MKILNLTSSDGDYTDKLYLSYPKMIEVAEQAAGIKCN